MVDNTKQEPQDAQEPYAEDIELLELQLENINDKIAELEASKKLFGNLCFKRIITEDELKAHDLPDNQQEAHAIAERKKIDFHTQIKEAKNERTGIEKALAEIRNKNETTEQSPDFLKPYIELIEQLDIYYVQRDHAYWQYSEPSNEWISTNIKDLEIAHPLLRDKESVNNFNDALRKLNRIFKVKNSSFLPQPPDTLNRMRKGNWIEPIAEVSENAKWFDYAIYAVAGGTQENIDHIMQVVGYKHWKPHTWQLPMLNIFGSGNSGKNLFAGTLLARIFKGGHKKLVLGSMDRFNAPLEGLAIAWFDECPDFDGENWLKRHVMNERIPVENKREVPTYVDNTALYVSTSQPVPIRIADDNSERRFSLIRSDLTLEQVVAQKEGISIEEARAKIEWADKHVWRNDREVGMWLHRCYQAAQALKAPPRALHGQDFKDAAQSQTDPVADACHQVFKFEGFEYIQSPVLYNIYKEIAHQDNPGARPLSTQKFMERVRFWLKRNTPHVERTLGKVKVKFANGTRLDQFVYVNTNSFSLDTKTFTDNTAFYSSGSHTREKALTPKVQKLMEKIVSLDAA